MGSNKLFHIHLAILCIPFLLSNQLCPSALLRFKGNPSSSPEAITLSISYLNLNCIPTFIECRSKLFHNGLEFILSECSSHSEKADGLLSRNLYLSKIPYDIVRDRRQLAFPRQREHPSPINSEAWPPSHRVAKACYVCHPLYHSRI